MFSGLVNKAWDISDRLQRKLSARKLSATTGQYAVEPDQAKALSDYEYGDLADLFFNNDAFAVRKWMHYFEVYERFFGSWRGKGPKFLEIGVDEGGSLNLWRRYFGPEATIFGIDINPACADMVSEPNQVRIGSQDDPQFLESVAGEMGSIDLILDDGSHVGRHQRTSFEALWPHLSDGGIYMIEDLHTAYFGHFEGGYGRRSTGIEMAKQAVDDMHWPYHARSLQFPQADRIRAVHFYDSLVVIEKGAARKPAHTRVGPPERLIERVGP